MLAIMIAEQQTSLFHFFYYLLSLWSSSSPTPGLSFIPILLLWRSSKALPRLTIILKELLCWLYTTMIIIFKLHFTLLNHCHTASPQTNEADQTGGFILSLLHRSKSPMHSIYTPNLFIWWTSLYQGLTCFGVCFQWRRPSSALWCNKEFLDKEIAQWIVRCWLTNL